MTYGFLPNDGNRGTFSWRALSSIKNYASGMLGLSLLSLAMTQTDKLILSKVLSLADFGIYTLASAVALSLQMLISPITKAWFPRLTQIQEIGDQKNSYANFISSISHCPGWECGSGNDFPR